MVPSQQQTATTSGEPPAPHKKSSAGMLISGLQQLSPTSKGMRNFCYISSPFTNRPHSIKEWERLASLTERYSTGVCGMRGMVAPLHNAVAECHARAARSSCAHRSAWYNVRAEQKPVSRCRGS